MLKRLVDGETGTGAEGVSTRCCLLCLACVITWTRGAWSLVAAKSVPAAGRRVVDGLVVKMQLLMSRWDAGHLLS